MDIYNEDEDIAEQRAILESIKIFEEEEQMKNAIKESLKFVNNPITTQNTLKTVKPKTKGEEQIKKPITQQSKPSINKDKPNPNPNPKPKTLETLEEAIAAEDEPEPKDEIIDEEYNKIIQKLFKLKTK